MSGEQLAIKKVEPSATLVGEELDHAIYDCMTTIWKAYRESVTTRNYKPYNSCFSALYEKYPDVAVQRYIQGVGLGLVDAVNRRIKNES